MHRACKVWVLTDYQAWGFVDDATLSDPQWWEDVLLFLHLRAVQEQPDLPDFVTSELARQRGGL